MLVLRIDQSGSLAWTGCRVKKDERDNQRPVRKDQPLIQVFVNAFGHLQSAKSKRHQAVSSSPGWLLPNSWASLQYIWHAAIIISSYHYGLKLARQVSFEEGATAIAKNIGRADDNKGKNPGRKRFEPSITHVSVWSAIRIAVADNLTQLIPAGSIGNL